MCNLSLGYKLVASSVRPEREKEREEEGGAWAYGQLTSSLAALPW
jgi:hypothetical protein